MKGGDSGAGVVVVAMGGMRLEVIVHGGVQRRGVAVGEGMVSKESGGPLSLFKACGLSAIRVSDSGTVDVWGVEAVVSLLLNQ